MFFKSIFMSNQLFFIIINIIQNTTISSFHLLGLSTGQKSQGPEEILEFVGEVEDDVTKKIEAVAEERLERPPKRFLKEIGRSRSRSCSPAW